MVDGRVVMRDRQLLTLNKPTIIAQVARAMERLARRVPEQRIQLYNP
jgi:5-methylthioadenosine/S-adenosylhomocysteine deaminase